MLLLEAQQHRSLNLHVFTLMGHLQVTSSNQSLICVKKAVGHTKAVLSICAADNLLVSGSKGKCQLDSNLMH